MMNSEQIVSSGTLIGALLIILIGLVLFVGVVYLLVKCYRKLSVLVDLMQKDNEGSE